MRMNLHLGPGAKFAVELFANVMVVRKPTPKFLEARNNEPLTCQTKWVCNDTGSYLFDHQVMPPPRFHGPHRPKFPVNRLRRA